MEPNSREVQQFSGSFLESCGALFHRETTIIRGKRGQIVGILQERYGLPSQEAEAQAEQFIQSLVLSRHKPESSVSLGAREQARRAGQT